MTTIGSADASTAVQAVEAFYAALADGDLPTALARLHIAQEGENGR